MESMMPIAVWV